MKMFSIRLVFAGLFLEGYISQKGKRYSHLQLDFPKPKMEKSKNNM